MSAVDDILGALNIDQLAQQVGGDPTEVAQAAQNALPALLGGLQANAQDPAGAASLGEALTQHDNDLLDGGVDLEQVDVADGQRITSHIFGSNEQQVVNQLGGLGGGGGLVGKLLPLLAPLALSWLAKRVGGARQQADVVNEQADAQQGGGLGGGLGDILGNVLGGGQGAGGQGGGLGDILGNVLGRGAKSGGQGGGGVMDVLGGLLGGGRR